MEKRTMNTAGVETSLLGFGCMRFPMTEDKQVNEQETEKMLDRAYAAGVNYFDTAYPYLGGESERVVGRVLKKYDRSSFYLATKLPVWKVEKLEDVDVIITEQLEKLQMDYIDFYLLHALNKEKWEKMKDLGAVERLKELKEEGKLRNLGFSFHDSYEVFEEIINYTDWDFCQIQLNYMDTEIQAGLKGYELTVQKQIPLVIMEPVKGGSLAAFSDDIAEKFHALDKEASIASYALRWVGSLPNVKVVLSGMSTMEQVEDNLKTFEQFKPLNEEERTTIEEVVRIIKSRVQNGCTGCSYCMPCPFGVNIPGTFSIWNTYHMYQNDNLIKRRWDGMEESAKPINCAKCGKCEQACPQKIQIREDLAKAQADLDNIEKKL